MRRLVAILSTLALIASLTVSSVAAAPGGQANSFVGEFELQDQATGAVIGHGSAQLAMPTEQRLVPGHWDFYGVASNTLRESHGQLGQVQFWYDPTNQGGSNVAYATGVECIYYSPTDSFCHAFTAMFVDVLNPAATDYVVFEGQDRYEPHGWSEFIYNIGKGSFNLHYVGSQGVPQVVHANLPCDVSWSTTPGGIDSAGRCDVQNVMTRNGGYKLTLHGQIPADQMAAFRAAGSPSSFATTCLVNYGFLKTTMDGQDWTGLMVFTPSVRHFTRDGKMTEVCEKSR